jgi:hypothetical protein
MIKSIKILLLIILLSGSCFSQNKPVVSLTDKTFNLYIDYDLDTPTTWGYQSPDLKSKKSICFSSETSIIEGYQSKCILGCYYETLDLDIQYVGIVGAFVKLKFKKEGKADVIFYVKKTDVRIDK